MKYWKSLIVGTILAATISFGQESDDGDTSATNNYTGQEIAVNTTLINTAPAESDSIETLVTKPSPIPAMQAESRERIKTMLGKYNILLENPDTLKLENSALLLNKEYYFLAHPDTQYVKNINSEIIFLNETVSDSLEEILAKDNPKKTFIKHDPKLIEEQTATEVLSAIHHTRSVGKHKREYVANLVNNYPNPFNNSTIINFKVLKQEPVMLNVYDAAGRLVTHIDRGVLMPGNYQERMDFDRASGIYFIYLQTPNHSSMHRVLHIK